MYHTITVGIFLYIGFIWLLLTISFNVTMAVQNKDADFTGEKGIATLYPDKLMVLINRLHTVADDTESKVRFCGNLILWEAHQLNIIFTQKLACARRGSERTNWHLNKSNLRLGRLLNRHILPCSYQICPIVHEFFHSFVI